MPTKGFYLDEDTYRKLQEEADKQGLHMGEVLGDIVRIELSKRESTEQRPKSCPHCAEAVKQDPSLEIPSLQWHLTADSFALLYCICPRCGWRFDSGEVFRTNVLKYLIHRPRNPLS